MLDIFLLLCYIAFFRTTFNIILYPTKHLNAFDSIGLGVKLAVYEQCNKRVQMKPICLQHEIVFLSRNYQIIISIHREIFIRPNFCCWNFELKKGRPFKIVGLIASNIVSKIIGIISFWFLFVCFAVFLHFFCFFLLLLGGLIYHTNTCSC